MKLGPAEGTPQEIKDFMASSDFDFLKFVELPPPPLATRWVVSPFVVFVGLVVVLQCIPTKPVLPMVVAGLCAATWLCAAVHYRWKMPTVTWIVAVGAFFTLLVAAGLLLPTDIAKYAPKSGG